MNPSMKELLDAAGIDVQPLLRKYDPEATMRVIKQYIKELKPITAKEFDAGLRKHAEEALNA